jgi:endonuclease/exonuclease/phosphatase family metal-dependent hydrolase
MRTLRFLWLMLSAALTTSCAGSLGPAAGDQTATTSVLRVMSYNIRCGSCEKVDDPNHWSRRRSLVAQTIRSAQADLVGLQEAELFQIRDLIALLPQYDWMGVGRDDGAEKGEMNAVLVRRAAFTISSRKTFWLSETPERVSRGWDAALNRTLSLLKLRRQSDGREFIFANTHFDHVGQLARRESARLIDATLQREAGGLPVILTGDLNDRPGSVAHRLLTQVLVDAAVTSVTPLRGGDLTFNGFGSDLQAGNKIDYVMVDGLTQVLSHQVLSARSEGPYASDHYALLVELRLR